MALSHLPVLNTPNLYVFSPSSVFTLILTFVISQPSLPTSTIWFSLTSRTVSPIFFEKSAILPFVLSKATRIFVSVKTPIPSESSEQSSCIIFFSDSSIWYDLWLHVITLFSATKDCHLNYVYSYY